MTPVPALHTYWEIGIVVDEQVYLGELNRARDVLLVGATIAVLVLLALVYRLSRRVENDLGVLIEAASDFEAYRFESLRKSPGFAEFGSIYRALESARLALQTLGKFAPLQLVQRMHMRREEAVLGGQLEVLSILFSDLTNFTSLSETLPPQDLGRMLGEYFQEVTAAIHAHHGVIDKYIGDAVMALFNAPERLEEHAFRACQAALAHREASRKFWNGHQVKTAIRACIGVHTSQVMVGNFGAPERMSYTAIGDGVNLASRLEGLNRVYRTEILVSGETRTEVGDRLVFRQVDRVAVKGKNQPVEVFELQGNAGEVSSEQLASNSLYESALTLYFEGRFAEAQASFARLPDDPAAVVLLERCNFFGASPPPDWNGTLKLTSK